MYDKSNYMIHRDVLLFSLASPLHLSFIRCFVQSLERISSDRFVESTINYRVYRKRHWPTTVSITWMNDELLLFSFSNKSGEHFVRFLYFSCIQSETFAHIVRALLIFSSSWSNNARPFLLDDLRPLFVSRLTDDDAEEPDWLSSFQHIKGYARRDLENVLLPLRSKKWQSIRYVSPDLHFFRWWAHKQKWWMACSLGIMLNVLLSLFVGCGCSNRNRNARGIHQATNDPLRERAVGRRSSEAAAIRHETAGTARTGHEETDERLVNVVTEAATLYTHFINMFGMGASKGPSMQQDSYRKFPPLSSTLHLICRNLSLAWREFLPCENFAPFLSHWSLFLWNAAINPKKTVSSPSSFCRFWFYFYHCLYEFSLHRSIDVWRSSSPLIIWNDPFQSASLGLFERRVTRER